VRAFSAQYWNLGIEDFHAMINFRQGHVLLIGVVALSLLAISVRTTANPQGQTEPKKVDQGGEVRHRLVMLPNYSVFDNLAATIEGSKVVLTGRVLHPKLRADAEATAKKIKGVTRVQNDVRLLPSLSSDDRVRQATYRAIYTDPALSRYRYSARPLIHIVVERGAVSLEGAAYDESDVTVAGLLAKSVPNVSSVRNNLGVLGPPVP
jgi:hypothetical protein